MVVATKKRPKPKQKPLAGENGEKTLEIPAEAHTYAGFLQWVMASPFPEKLRVSYHEGSVSVDMSEENIDTHSMVKIAVYRTLLPLALELDFGEVYPDGVLFCNESANVANNPDGVGARWETFESGKVSFILRQGTRRALEGAPDWVLEIVSDSSVTKDLTRLRAAYHRAGIAEYWLIDARGDEITFQILSWKRAGYVPVPNKEGWGYSKVFGRSFRLTRQQNRIGAWGYNLEVRREDNKSKARS